MPPRLNNKSIWICVAFRIDFEILYSPRLGAMYSTCCYDCLICDMSTSLNRHYVFNLCTTCEYQIGNALLHIMRIVSDAFPVRYRVTEGLDVLSCNYAETCSTLQRTKQSLISISMEPAPATIFCCCCLHTQDTPQCILYRVVPQKFARKFAQVNMGKAWNKVSINPLPKKL